jgi:cellulose synthase operon protein YhjQ
MVERKKDEITGAAEDVATLYSWANLHGAKYRDFSASRQELRAQSRHRMMAEQDALAQEAVEQSAKENTRPAAEAAASPQTAPTVEAATSAQVRPEMRPLREPQGGNKAVVQYERMPASPVERRPEPAAASVPPLAASPAAPQPYAVPAPPVEPRNEPGWAVQQDPLYREPDYRELPQYRDQPYREMQNRESQYREPQSREPQYGREPQGWDQVYREPQHREQPYQNQPYQSPYQNPYPGPQFQESRYPAPPFVDRRNPNRGGDFSGVERRSNRDSDLQARAAWMAQQNDPMYGSPAGGGETLQQSRERVASRWFALKGVFGQPGDQGDPQTMRQKDVRVPALAVFSLAGGVGKTSLVATLGRSLSALGERVLLADTTSYGLLPYYFGARDLRPGVVRTFSAPGSGADAPVNLLSVDTERLENDPADMDWLTEDLQRNARGSNRILVDLATASASLTRRVLRMSPVVLVPIIPDMNSIVTLSVVDGFFRNHHGADGRPVQPFYVLNQFDPSLPLHLDVREVLRQQLGDRLLPFVLRRSQAVSEALAEGMTVVDYAPNSSVADDYQHLAGWLRSVSAPASLAFRGMRWSER